MSKLATLLRGTYLNPCPLFRTIRVNFCRRNSVRTKKGGFLFTSYSVADIHATATLNMRHLVRFGYKKYRGSRLETSLWMDRNAQLTVGSRYGGVSVYHGCDIQIFENAKLAVGGKVVMNRGAQIICQEEIVIGDECLISRDVVIRDNDGGHTMVVDGYKKTAPVHIGNHVWIGQGALILKGTTIGDGSVIGAGAVVFGCIKPNSLVMADPSRIFAKDIKWEP